ncbi:WAS/WASL-interacting protein family member 3 isoform X1 [Stegostoma tigrinum]|uniref:WAS/WASL-interacting protein family member 3 isoform X1 n=2 Tax=Stegostoma tigrinum TaxID=3053191 RepID=UPI00286FC16E|nr:WAS/WASL-interacting protein family member 3 isoform X1 [Stegostoma tigrinum]XP_059510246.1 WAS/WASL-interacting protein family member 3 isoform X1 [Stegostoma tigrinum]XP_059510247.1 WAS/WASL-interacting protein family member 3 isoform X1 [Stegostoma tigrinum]XP_059510250.1 WAS/WASL-interacting protein family member 3 isoform X1 [Stegostoma tigrinum]
MPVPPPPPPPGAPPLPSARVELPKQTTNELKGRSALLGDIHKGVRLKRVTQINDRSAPNIDKPKNGCGAGAVGGTSTPTAVGGGMFQGGFPVLRPAGQRDASERGSKPAVQPFGMKVQTSRHSVQNDSARNDKNALKQSERPDSFDLSKVQKTIQGHHNVSALTPTFSQNKSLSTCPSSTSSSFNNKSTKTVTTIESPSPPVAPSLPPPPPPMLANVKPFKFQYTQPPPSPLPPPPSPPPSDHFQDQASDFIFPAPPPPSLLCIEDCTDFPLPPPPPPPLHPGPAYSPYNKTEDNLPPPPPSLLNGVEVPPALPPKLPNFSNKPSLSSIPLLPPPPPPPLPPPPPPPPPFPAYGHPGSSLSSGQMSHGTQLSGREGPGRSGVHSSGGKLAPPPLPPVRSSSTELTSRNQHTPSPIWTSLCPVPPPPPPPPPVPPPPLPLKVRQGISITQSPVSDDFESKYNFHSVEDLPPPDEYKSFPRIYPSKQPRVNHKNHRATTPLR